jgi:hypothetical protein
VRREPGWPGAALTAALGALAGVLVTLALGGGASSQVQTVTVVTPPPTDALIVAQTAVPRVVGERLDVAKRRVGRAGFLAEVEGGGIAALLHDRRWRVAGQSPRAGKPIQTGSPVHLRVTRR